MRDLLARLTALVLTTLILNGGGGMPVVDALTHGSGADYAGIPHYEATSSSDNHRDFCSLGAGLPLAAHLSPFHLDVPVGVISFPEAAAHPSPPRSADLRLLPQPRAPPSLAA